MWQAKTKFFGRTSLIFACLVFMYLTNLSFAQTSSVSPWLVTGNPTLEKIGDVDLTKPLPKNIISNRDCQMREVITRPRRYVPPQEKISQMSCVVDTGYGAVSNDGLLQRSGSSVYGALNTSSGGSSAVIPIPKSSTGLSISGGQYYGSYLFFYDNLEPNITSNAAPNGEVAHKLPNTYTTMLKDGAGNLLTPDISTAGFSANGDWMVLDIPKIAMARVNIKTREVLPFGDPSNPYGSNGAAFKTAVSPDGKYALEASSVHNILSLYDLSTCGAVPATLTTKVACKSRDLLLFMQQQIPGFNSLASVRFRSNYTLDVYANSTIGNVTKLTHYVVTASGQQTAGFQYLALGDSFASGEGAYNYKASTDTSDNKCHLSQRSYPYLMASALGYGQYESVACSGAIINNINNEKYVEQKPQAKGKTDKTFDENILLNFLPGYRTQTFFEIKKPNIITLSAGGNDIGFSDIILRCIDTDTCYNSFEDRLELADLINKQFQPLTKMYDDVKASTDPRAKIYVIGYPQIANTNGICDLNVHLNRDERVFAQQLVNYLNSVIKKAAQNSGVYYVDVEEAFAGHKMCDDVPSWQVAINGLTAGNDQINLPFIHGPIGNESYHPNAYGHSLLAEKILEKTSNFTAGMPTPDPSATASDPDPNSAFLQAPKTNSVIRNLKHYTGTDGGIMKAGTYWVWDATGLDSAFATGSQITAWLHSTPTNLGAYTLGTDGSINIRANIPSTLEPGLHTLHLYGKNSSGEDIDVYKTVYVDTGSPCLVPVSGQDTDKDGTDDACDGLITQPPIVVAPQPAPVIINPPVEPIPPAPQPIEVIFVPPPVITPVIVSPPVQVIVAPEPPVEPPIVVHEELISTTAAQENNSPQTAGAPTVLAQNTQPALPSQLTVASDATAQVAQPEVLSATTPTQTDSKPQTTATNKLVAQTLKPNKLKLNYSVIVVAALVILTTLLLTL